MEPVFFFVLGDVHHRLGMDENRIGTAFCGLWMISKAVSWHRNASSASSALRSGLIDDFHFRRSVPQPSLLAIALGIFRKLGIKPGSNFGKAIMLGIPIGSLIGGVGTPAGSSINLLGLQTMASEG